MEIVQGEVYLEGGHVELLRNEAEYVRKRYHAVAKTLAPDESLRIPRKQAAEIISRSKRQIQRIVKRFKEEGIPGLRFKPNTPHTPPKNKTPEVIENRVIEVRKATGFGSAQLAAIVNESLKLKEQQQKISQITDTTCYNILARNDLVEAERRLQKEYKRFEWSRPDALIQSDLTSFNGFPILTMEDDHSRKGWAMRLNDAKDDAIVEGMQKLHSQAYENLLTDNGRQFARNNSTMRKYCEQYLTGKHIWSSIHHPQTLGKLSNFQKGMKSFLRHRLGCERDPNAIDECIKIYTDWYNNGKLVSTTKCYPEERYSGKRDLGWYQRLVKALKLDRI
ncbi:MAG: helix-turn-helix domain-containing protein, partial [Rhabdochlamydiaceae bacterium]